MRAFLAVLLALTLAGCAAPSLTQDSAQLTKLIPKFGEITKVGEQGFEPVLRVAQDGTIYVASLQYLFVSRDNGSSFRPSQFTNMPIYASDSALSIAPGGRVYIAFDWPYAGETAVCNSADRGASWECVDIAVPGATDRMWVLAPNDKDVYLITGQTLDRPTFAVSHDSGKTFAITYYDWTIESQGGDLSWDPVQERVIEGAWTDAGWGIRSWKPDGTFVGVAEMKFRTPEPLVMSSPNGVWWALACVEDEGPECSLVAARSADQGATWSFTPIPMDAKRYLLPYLTVGSEDNVAVAWYQANGSSNSDAANEWTFAVSQTRDGASWTTQVLTGEPVHKGAMCSAVTCLGEDRFAGDFLGLGFGPDGALHASWMRQVGDKFPPVSQLATEPWDFIEYARTT